MRVKLLRKVRKYAEWLIDNNLRNFKTVNGRVVQLSYPHCYRWAFHWMFGERWDYHADRAKRKGS